MAFSVVIMSSAIMVHQKEALVNLHNDVNKHVILCTNVCIQILNTNCTTYFTWHRILYLALYTVVFSSCTFQFHMCSGGFTCKLQTFVCDRLVFSYINMTGYWKTNQNFKLSLFHFSGPANSYTHTLPMHCCINSLS